MGFVDLVLKILRILFLLFLAFSLMADLSAYLFLSTTLDVFLEPKTISNALDKQNFSGMLQTTMIESIQIGNTSEGNATMFEGGNLSKDEAKQAIKEVLSEEWIKQKTTNVVTDFILYLRGEKGSFHGEIPIGELKPKIINASIKLLTKSLDAGIDEKLVEPIDLPGLSCNSAKECLAYCEKSNDDACIVFYVYLNNALGLNSSKKITVDEIKNKMRLLLTEKMSEEFSNFPDSIKLIEPGSEQEKMLAGLRQLIGTAQLASLALLVLAIILAGTTALVAFSIKGALRWVGVPLLLVGLILIAVSFLTPPLIEKAVEESIKPAIPTGNASGNNASFSVVNKIMEMAKGIVFDITESFFSALRIKAGVITLIGIIMTAVSFFVGGKPKVPQSSPPHS